MSIESVQIIKIKQDEFIFDYDAVKRIIDINKQNLGEGKDIQELQVAIIVINGALRTGKSFFINFMIRHLLKLEKESSNNSIDKENNTDMLDDYFRSRRGTDIQTLGIWVLNKIFIHKGMAIIIMDTQGIFDRHLNQAMNTALICLSTLLSSYQIYNLDKRIQDNYINNAYFSAYTDLLSEINPDKDNNDDNYDNDNNSNNNSNNSKKIGQTLSLLVRDWQNFEDVYDMDNCIRETNKYQRDFMSDNSEDKIMKIFDRVNVRLCPHPGHLVTEGEFTGNLNSIRKEFLLHVEYIIGDILSNLEPKKIVLDKNNRKNLLFSDVPEFMQRHVDLYRNINKLAEPKTILETTTKMSQNIAKTYIIEQYKKNMIDALGSKKLTKDEIHKIHMASRTSAMSYYNKIRMMGNTREIMDIKNKIEREILQEYYVFAKMASDKNIWYLLSRTSNKIIEYIIPRNINLQYINIFFFALLFFGNILIFLSNIFLPSYLSYFINYILNTVLCITLGMVISHNNNYNKKIR